MGNVLLFRSEKTVETIPPMPIKIMSQNTRIRLRARIQLAVAERHEADYRELKFRYMPEPVVAVIEPTYPGSKSVMVTKRRAANG